MAYGSGGKTAAMHELCSSGILNPSSPGVASMIKYGEDFALNLNQGTLGLQIPIYDYSDERFSLGVSLGYSGGGYRPNSSSGPCGMGWNLVCGGAITREVRGIPDEEGWTSTDMYSFHNRNYNGQSEGGSVPNMFGWASLYDTTRVASLYPDTYRFSTTGYFRDYAYTGKAGADYMPIWGYNTSTGWATAPSYETFPDLFHFSFLGRTGSFILQPDGVINVFGTEDSPLNYTVTAQLTRNDGFLSFTIKTEDNCVYTFGGPAGRELSDSYNKLGTTEDLTLCSTWLLTGIEAPDGRTVSFTYGETETQYTFTPTYTYDKTDLDPDDPEYDEEEGDQSDSHHSLFIQTVPTVSRVFSRLLTRIGITGRAEILFQYGDKVGEPGADDTRNKLERITVRSLHSGDTVRTAVLCYRLSGTPVPSYPSSGSGITFLSEVIIPGTGIYRMEYEDEESTAFPPLNTYAVDWMGFYNADATQSASSSSFCPSRSVLSAGTDLRWNVQIRKGNLAAAKMGALRKLVYPTGGSSEFDYELNTYATDLVYPQAISTSAPGYGIRLSEIRNTDADGCFVNRRHFFYEGVDGRSSGTQLWRPCIYSEYTAVSSSYDQVYHQTVSTADNFPYSRGSFMEYARVLETEEGGKGTVGRSITEYCYSSYESAQYRDILSDWDDEASFPFGTWYYQVNDESVLNTRARTEAGTYLLSRLGGRLLSRTEYSDDLYHPVRKTVNNYSSNSRTAAVIVDDMQYGYSVKYNISHEDPYLREAITYEYTPAGAEMGVQTQTYTLGSDFRISSESSVDSRGDVLTTTYTYFSPCPSNLSEVKTVRTASSGTGSVVEGVRRTYIGVEGMDGLFIPVAVYASDTGGSTTFYRLESSCREWTGSGLPLEIVDKAGISTCILWGYGGMYPVAKIVGKTYEDLCEEVPSAGTGMFSGALPDGIRTALRALQGVEVTTWEWAPLLGMTSATGPSGKKVSYEYDSYGRLVRTKDNASRDLKRYEYGILTDE
ncbi:MAG: hypothetical protein IJR77_07200 [Bacteroidales bacterium]|nr:hypothetical protein [Bacteroidales bacterium]